MPKYDPSEDEMDESYRSPSSDTSSEAEPQSEDEEMSTATTAVVPNKLLSPDGSPIKEGDEIVVRIVKTYGDESEIEYAPKESGASEEDTSGESAYSPGNEESELTAMSKE